MKKKIYLILFIVVLGVSIIGSTYAYWTATATSPSKSVNTASTGYNIKMLITPLYSDFRFIPMDNSDALTALKNGCRDKYDRGACSAYTININGYDENTNFISGTMDVTLENITNLSYMVLEEQEEYDEDNCVTINEKNYCISTNATPVGDGINLSLGDHYEVTNTTETNLILLIWLTNLDESQNDVDLGDFSSVITFSMGSGGEIKGSIAASIIADNNENGG